MIIALGLAFGSEMLVILPIIYIGDRPFISVTVSCRGPVMHSVLATDGLAGNSVGYFHNVIPWPVRNQYSCVPVLVVARSIFAVAVFRNDL